MWNAFHLVHRWEGFEQQAFIVPRRNAPLPMSGALRGTSRQSRIVFHGPAAEAGERLLDFLDSGEGSLHLGDTSGSECSAEVRRVVALVDKNDFNGVRSNSDELTRGRTPF